MVPRAALDCAGREAVLLRDFDDSGPYPARLVGDQRRRFAPGADTQLVEAGRQVRLHRALRETELRGDLAVRVAHGYEGEHLLLAVGEGRSREWVPHRRR